jgi:hypothetical protein
MKTVIQRISILLVMFLVVTAFALSQQAQQAQQQQQCKAILKNGTQCKRMAQPGSIYCRQHTRMYGNGFIKPTTPAKTKQTVPTEPEQIIPAKTEQTVPAKTEQIIPAKTEPTTPAKTEK